MTFPHKEKYVLEIVKTQKSKGDTNAAVGSKQMRVEQRTNKTLAAAEEDDSRFDVLRRVEFKPHPKDPGDNRSRPIRLAPGKREESKIQERRRIHAQRRARRINDIIVGWRDAHSKQGF